MCVYASNMDVSCDVVDSFTDNSGSETDDSDVDISCFPRECSDDSGG